MKLPTIPQALEFRREQLGLTAKRMAFNLGLRPSHYSEVIAGRRNLPFRSARFAFKLGVPAKVLFQVQNPFL